MGHTEVFGHLAVCVCECVFSVHISRNTHLLLCLHCIVLTYALFLSLHHIYSNVIPYFLSCRGSFGVTFFFFPPSDESGHKKNVFSSGYYNLYPKCSDLIKIPPLICSYEPLLHWRSVSGGQAPGSVQELTA